MDVIFDLSNKLGVQDNNSKNPATSKIFSSTKFYTILYVRVQDSSQHVIPLVNKVDADTVYKILLDCPDVCDVRLTDFSFIIVK